MIFPFIPGNNGYFSINYFKMCWLKNGISLVKTKVIDKRVKVNHWPPYKLRNSNLTTQTRILTITKHSFWLILWISKYDFSTKRFLRGKNSMERIVVLTWFLLPRKIIILHYIEPILVCVCKKIFWKISRTISVSKMIWYKLFWTLMTPIRFYFVIASQYKAQVLSNDM